MVKATKTDEVKDEKKVSTFDARLGETNKEKKKVGVAAVKNDDTELKQHSYRCTDEEFSQFEEWVGDINELSGKKGRGYTAGSIIRAVISMRDNINEKQLLKALRENV